MKILFFIFLILSIASFLTLRLCPPTPLKISFDHKIMQCIWVISAAGWVLTALYLQTVNVQHWQSQDGQIYICKDRGGNVVQIDTGFVCVYPLKDAK